VGSFTSLERKNIKLVNRWEKMGKKAEPEMFTPKTELVLTRGI